MYFFKSSRITLSFKMSATKSSRTPPQLYKKAHLIVQPLTGEDSYTKLSKILKHALVWLDYGICFATFIFVAGSNANDSKIDLDHLKQYPGCGTITKTPVGRVYNAKEAETAILVFLRMEGGIFGRNERTKINGRYGIYYVCWRSNN